MGKDNSMVSDEGTKAERKFYAAQRCINKIDDMFEYRHKFMTPLGLQTAIREYLKEYTADLVKLEKECG